MSNASADRSLVVRTTSANAYVVLMTGCASRDPKVDFDLYEPVLKVVELLSLTRLGKLAHFRNCAITPVL